MTFLQKLLGKNYKWWHVIYFYFKSTTSGIYAFLFAQFSDIAQILGITYIWILNQSSNEVITYLIIGRIFKSLSDCFVAEVLAPEVASGKISNYLMLPTDFISFYAAREIGRRLVFNFGRAISLLVAILVYFKYLDFKFISLTNLLLFLPLVVLSFVTSFFIEFIVGFSISFFDDKRSHDGLRRSYNGLFGIGGILTGIIIPLDKLPLYKEIIQFLPTTYSLHHPMQIYLGNYNPNQTLLVFLGGIFWCFALYFLAKIVFKAGLKRNESVGL